MPGIPFTLDLDVQKESPLESRSFGNTAPWIRHASSTFIYNGFTYTWYTANESDRGIYICLNKTSLGQPGSWERIGSVDMSDYYTRQQVDNLLVQSTDFGPYISASKGPQNTLYNKSFWSDLSDFDVIGTPPTIVDGKIRLAGSYSSFDASSITLKNGTGNDAIDYELTFRVLSTGGGLSIGRRSQSFLAKCSMSAAVNIQNNTLYLHRKAEGSLDEIKAQKSIPEVIAYQNDLCKLIYSQRGNSFICTFVNLTKCTYYQIKTSTNLHLNIGWFLPNFGVFSISALGAVVDIISIKAISRQPYAPRFVAMGDSKTIGYSAEAMEGRYLNHIEKFGSVAVFAGAADTTVEIRKDIDYVASLGAEYGIVAVGRNDGPLGVPDADTKANYQYIIATLKANNVLPIHLVNIPDYQTDQTAFRDWVFATFPNDLKIDLSIGWNYALHLSNDNLHPTVEGHLFIAQRILDLNVITVPPYQFAYERPMLPDLGFAIDRTNTPQSIQFPQDAVLYQFVDTWAEAQQIQPDPQSIIIIKVSNDEGHNNEQNTRYELWPDGTFGRVGFTQI